MNIHRCVMYRFDKTPHYSCACYTLPLCVNNTGLQAFKCTPLWQCRGVCLCAWNVNSSRIRRQSAFENGRKLYIRQHTHTHTHAQRCAVPVCNRRTALHYSTDFVRTRMVSNATQSRNKGVVRNSGIPCCASGGSAGLRLRLMCSTEHIYRVVAIKVSKQWLIFKDRRNIKIPARQGLAELHRMSLPHALGNMLNSRKHFPHSRKFHCCAPKRVRWLPCTYVLGKNLVQRWWLVCSFGVQAQ